MYRLSAQFDLVAEISRKGGSPKTGTQSLTVYRHGLHPKTSFSREPTEFYALERFSEAVSAPIRSALKLYFGIDVRIFSQLFLKNIFFRTSKQFFEKSTILDKNWKNLKNRNFKISKIENFKILKIWKCSFFSMIFFYQSKIFFWKKWEKIRTSISK